MDACPPSIDKRQSALLIVFPFHDLNPDCTCLDYGRSPFSWIVISVHIRESSEGESNLLS